MKRKRESDDITPHSKLSSDAKDMIALNAIICEELGVPLSTYRQKLEEHNIKVSKTTMHEWMKSYKLSGHALSTDKKTGAEHKLSPEKIGLFIGWVLSQNEKVHLLDAQRFILDRLGVNMTTTTVGTYLHDNGFALHPTKGMKHKNGNDDFYAECLEHYRIFNGEDARGHVLDAPKGLESRLDGRSWREKKSEKK